MISPKSPAKRIWRQAKKRIAVSNISVLRETGKWAKKLKQDKTAIPVKPIPATFFAIFPKNCIGLVT